MSDLIGQAISESTDERSIAYSGFMGPYQRQEDAACPMMSSVAAASASLGDCSSRCSRRESISRSGGPRDGSTGPSGHEGNGIAHALSWCGLHDGLSWTDQASRGTPGVILGLSCRLLDLRRVKGNHTVNAPFPSGLSSGMTARHAARGTSGVSNCRISPWRAVLAG